MSYWIFSLTVLLVGFVTGSSCRSPAPRRPRSREARAETVCHSILGPEYRSTGVGEPPVDLARLVGAVAAAGTAIITLGALTFAERRRREM